MNVKSARFVKSAVKAAQYPPPDYPEIAFAGRSNVGKSSMINALVRRKRLVKTSNTPGRTQTINFFVINESISFVDLPGYGYAKVPAAVRNQWGPMIETYLKTRKSLRGVVLILDVRRTPGDDEFNFMAWLNQYRIPCLPVLTKSDKPGKTRLPGIRKAAAEALGMEADSLILFSAKTKMGKESLERRLEVMLHSPDGETDH
jgi:GTP-binding protein